jgi:hypothetical protein
VQCWCRSRTEASIIWFRDVTLAHTVVTGVLFVNEMDAALNRGSFVENYVIHTRFHAHARQPECVRVPHAWLCILQHVHAEHSRAGARSIAAFDPLSCSFQRLVHGLAACGFEA